MPTYQFSCPSCSSKSNLKLTFEAYQEVRSGTHTELCSQCNETMNLDFAPGDLKMVMKEGPSGGWESKASKERKFREARYAHMGKKQRDNHFVATLQPNYQGEETGTWRGAQEAARKDKGDEVAAQYTPLVEQEKK